MSTGGRDVEEGEGRDGKPDAWLYVGEDEDDMFIVGSPEGLRALRNHIDQALEWGDSPFDAGIDTDFNGVRCKETRSDPTGSSLAGSLLGWGCLALLLAISVLAAYGLWSLIP